MRVVWGFDAFNNVLGSSSLGRFNSPEGCSKQLTVADTHVSAGGYEDTEIHQHFGERQEVQYLDVIASDDEICITYVGECHYCRSISALLDEQASHDQERKLATKSVAW